MLDVEAIGFSFWFVACFQRMTGGLPLSQTPAVADARAFAAAYPTVGARTPRPRTLTVAEQTMKGSSGFYSTFTDLVPLLMYRLEAEMTDFERAVRVAERALHALDQNDYPAAKAVLDGSSLSESNSS
jgi:hypothetical protein